MDTFRERTNSDFRLAVKVSAAGATLFLLAFCSVILLPQFYGLALMYGLAPIGFFTFLWGYIRGLRNIKCPGCSNQLGKLFAVHRRWWGSVIPDSLRCCPFCSMDFDETPE